MAHIFITYGNENFTKSLRRIHREAKHCGFFDKVIIYHPEDMPPFIKAHPLMAFPRLGGYSVWKSYIIWKTYQEAQVGDIIVYADAGCSLQATKEWNTFEQLLEPDTTIVFQYRKDVDYGWKDGGWGPNAEVELKNWVKKSVRDYFAPLFNSDDDWLGQPSLWGGAILIRKGKKENIMLKEWFTTTLLIPNLSIDVFGNERDEQSPTFVEHRHCQALLSILAFYFSKSQKIIFYLETAESQPENAAIVASRLRDDREIKVPLGTRIRHFIKRVIGLSTYNSLKKITGRI